jgi:hypothetical protein
MEDGNEPGAISEPMGGGTMAEHVAELEAELEEVETTLNGIKNDAFLLGLRNKILDGRIKVALKMSARSLEKIDEVKKTQRRLVIGTSTGMMALASWVPGVSALGPVAGSVLTTVPIIGSICTGPLVAIAATATVAYMATKPKVSDEPNPYV